MMLQNCLIFVLLALLSIASNSLNVERIQLVDQFDDNFLFRMGSTMTEDGQSFDYDGIIENFRIRARENGFTLLANFQLIDICLMNRWKHKDQRHQVNVQKNYFKNNPDKGLFKHWAINAIHPPGKAYNYNPYLRTFFAATYDIWSLDNLNFLVEYIWRQLTSPSTGRPRVLFIHCMAGMDRTGEVFGAYQMMKAHWSYQQVMIYNNNFSDRPMQNKKAEALRWFCYFLKLEQEREQNDLECEYIYSEKN